jgi:hypothetical protein
MRQLRKLKVIGQKPKHDPAIEYSDGRVRHTQHKRIERRRVDFPSPTPQDTPCVLWQGTLDRYGYSRRWIYPTDGSPRYQRGMHRWVMEQLLERKLKTSEFVLHACDQPLCYRASHLSVGTVQDNNADMVAKGRNTKPPVNRMKGESNPNAKITDRDMRKIEQLWRNGFSAATIAAEFDVSPSAIRKRMNGIPKRPAPKSIYEIIREEKKKK